MIWRPLTVGFLIACIPIDSASAYVCSRVTDATGNEIDGASLSWFHRNLTYSLHPEGTKDIDDDGTAELTILRESFQVWEDLEATTGLPCTEDDAGTDIKFTEIPRTSTDRHVGYDWLDPDNNENLLLFWDSKWPHASESTQIIGLTTVTFNSVTGEILDADIEFNSTYFDFSSDDDSTDGKMDLKNTAVHEIGHYLGLGHEEFNTAATMYPQAEDGDVEKRDLDCDDTSAIALKYPKGKDNGYCKGAVSAACGYCAPAGEVTRIPSVSVTDSDDGSGGCSCSARSAAGSYLGWGAILVLSCMRRRPGSFSRSCQLNRSDSEAL